MRFAASYRNQWKVVPVPYSTFAGSFENKFYHKKGKYDRFFTGGLLFDYDRQGLLRLSSYLIGLNGSLTLPVLPNNFLTVGLHGSYNGRHFDDNKLEVDNQWNGKNFEPGLSFGETIDNEKIGFVDFGAGANWRWNNAARRAKIDVGAGLFHLTKPENNFFDNVQTKLNRRLSIYAMGSFRVSNRIDIAPQISFQKQGTYREFVPDLLVRFYLNPNVYQPVAIGFGLGARFNGSKTFASNTVAAKNELDALAPRLELLLGTWQFGFSYDINLSDFNVATNKRGGPELSAIYRLCKVKPLPMFKICPII